MKKHPSTSLRMTIILAAVMTLNLELVTLNCSAQNFNLTLASTYTYSTGTIANIGGWKSPVDGKEYALVGAHNGLSIVDVSNPAAPVQNNSYNRTFFFVA